MNSQWQVVLAAGYLACGVSFGATPAAVVEQTTAPMANYQLGVGDELKFRMVDVDDIDKTVVRIDSDGDITLPFIGRVHAKGETLGGLQQTVESKFKKYYKAPLITITVAEYRSRPVSVIGSVASPGVIQLRGQERIIDAISAAGGLREDADTHVQLVRKATFGRIPLSQARWDAELKFSVADIDVAAILAGSDTANNVELMPEDTISVSKARMVYVIGEVRKPGGYVVKESTPMSVLTALSMAEGLSSRAAAKKSRILRLVEPGLPRQEILVDVPRILDGTAADMSLLPDDIIVVPNNIPKSAALRSLEVAIQIGTGVAIFRR
jgi:polysaccharide biosynthesis/export protein